MYIFCISSHSFIPMLAFEFGQRWPTEHPQRALSHSL